MDFSQWVYLVPGAMSNFTFATPAPPCPRLRCFSANAFGPSRRSAYHTWRVYAVNKKRPLLIAHLTKMCTTSWNKLFTVPIICFLPCKRKIIDLWCLSKMFRNPLLPILSGTETHQCTIEIAMRPSFSYFMNALGLYVKTCFKAQMVVGQNCRVSWKGTFGFLTHSRIKNAK